MIKSMAEPPMPHPKQCQVFVGGVNGKAERFLAMQWAEGFILPIDIHAIKV